MIKNRVFVSAINVKSTEISDLNDLHFLIETNKPNQLKEFQVGDEKIYLGEEFNLDTSSKYYPSKSNEKVMRAEVIAATVCVGEMLNEAQIAEEKLYDIPLYISTGICFERMEGDMDWFSKVIQSSLEATTIKDKNIRMNQIIPPLISLRTLTNATSSFVAQYCKLAGNNSTFGITSQSAFCALKEAFRAIETGESDFAFAGGASRGGLSSYFMFKNFNPSLSNWKECSSASFLLLESEESLIRKNKKPLCEITDLFSSKAIPEILNPVSQTPFSEFSSAGNVSDLCIFGGAFRISEHEEAKKGADAIWEKTFSLYPLMGNFGPAGLFMNIAASLYFFNKNKFRMIDCADRDPYNRESLVRLTI